MFKIFKKWREKGQTFVEYGVVIAVVACIAIAGFASAGSSINDKVTAMAGSTEEPEPTSAYWGVSTDGVLTLSTKTLSADECAFDSGNFELADFQGFPLNNWRISGDAQAVNTVNIKDHMAPSGTANWFDNLSNLKTINNIHNLDTSKDTNMGGMFSRCSSLTSLDLSSFDTSSVTNMLSMFNSCSKLTSLNMSSFNTSNVRNMMRMFYNCSLLTSLDTSKFVISAGTNTTDMYTGCPAHK